MAHLLLLKQQYVYSEMLFQNGFRETGPGKLLFRFSIAIHLQLI